MECRTFSVVFHQEMYCHWRRLVSVSSVYLRTFEQVCPNQPHEMAGELTFGDYPVRDRVCRGGPVSLAFYC